MFQNIERVSASFPNVTRIKHVALKHLDFVIGRNRLAFYNDVIDDMLKYTWFIFLLVDRKQM